VASNSIGKPIFHGLGNGCVVTRALSPAQDHPARRDGAAARCSVSNLIRPTPALFTRRR
jgi:poly-gamma-glutamate synthesis protein (capsule biosynthesis protein)